MMTTNLFVISNVKQLRTDCSFRILLPFLQTSWGIDVLNSAVFNSFHNRVECDTILEGRRNFGGGGGGLQPPPRYATGTMYIIKMPAFITALTTDCESVVSDIPKMVNICQQQLACFDIRDNHFLSSRARGAKTGAAFILTVHEIL